MLRYINISDLIKLLMSDKLKDFRICKSLLSKSIGLMFQSKVKKKLIFVFKKEKIIPLHMLFVFCPIDVIFLDKKKKIVEIKKNFRPFSFYTPKKKSCFVIETQKGFVDKNKIKLGKKYFF